MKIFTFEQFTNESLIKESHFKVNETSTISVPKLSDIDHTRIIKWMTNQFDSKSWDMKKSGKGFEISIDKLSKAEQEDLMAYLKSQDYITESHFKVGDKVKMSHGGTGIIVSLDKEDGADDEAYYNVELSNGDMMKHAPNELEKINEASTEEMIKKEAISRLSDFFRISPNALSKFKFDGNDNVKDLTKALNSTSDQGTKLYYEMAIKLAKEEIGVDEAQTDSAED